jgi:3-oxoadipate enol-lactonase
MDKHCRNSNLLSLKQLQTFREKMSTSQSIQRPDGSVISFTVLGDTKNPALVLSNSLATDREMWQLVLPQLTKEYLVVTYDTRGHGLSKCAPNNIQLRDLADDVVAILDAAKIQKAFFAGISLGGMTGLTLALHYPERLLGLMACNCRGRIDAAGIEGWNQRLEVARKGGGMHALVELTLSRWFAQDYIATNPDQMKIVAGIISNNTVDGYESCIRAIQNVQMMDELHKIKIPVMLVAGAQDAGAPPAELQLIADQIQGSQMEVLDPCGHISPMQRPNDFVKLVQRFARIH